MTDTIFNREALKRLAELLETKVPKQNFDLIGWAEFWVDREQWEEIDDKLLVPHNCGATACACGYAGLDKWFRDQGFRTTNDGDIVYGQFIGWSAVNKFFRLNRNESEVLFDSDSYEKDRATPADVAERIRQFLKDPQRTVDDVLQERQARS